MVKLKNLYTFWKKINKLYTSLVYSILRVYSVVERICIRTEIEHRRSDEINPTSHPIILLFTAKSWSASFTTCIGRHILYFRFHTIHTHSSPLPAFYICHVRYVLFLRIIFLRLNEMFGYRYIKINSNSIFISKKNNLESFS